MIKSRIKQCRKKAFLPKFKQMKCTKYLFSVFIGTLIYVTLSLCVGQNSFRCYKYLENQKILLSKRTSDIQNINTELSLELTALQKDRAVIAAYARKLDYVSDDEKLVKITGLRPAQTTLYDTGTVLRHEDPEYLSEEACKIVSIFITILCLGVMFLLDISNGNISLKKERPAMIKGIPVYDFKQI